MSRNLDAAIGKALGLTVEYCELEGTDMVTYCVMENGVPVLPVDLYSKQGHAMLNLDAEMRARGWAIERIQFDGEVNTWSCEYMLTKSKHDMLNYVSVEADADTEPLARALAAYEALTGKEWGDN